MTKLLSFLLLLPLTSFAQAPASPSAGLVNALGWLDTTIAGLVTAKTDLFLRVGWEEFGLFSGFAITFFLIRTAAASRHHSVFDLEGATMLLGQMFFVAIFLTYYARPLVAGVSLHQIPMVVSHGLSELITQGQLDPLFLKMQAIQNHIVRPGLDDLLDLTAYLLTLILMALVAMVLFAINACNYVFLGLLSLFGPLAIPFFLTKHFSRWFFNWVGMLVSVSFMSVSIAGFTYIWTFFLMTLFENTIGGNYSLSNFLLLAATFIPCVGGFLYTGFKLASFNAELFNGAGGMAAGVASAIGSAARMLVSKGTTKGSSK